MSLPHEIILLRDACLRRMAALTKETAPAEVRATIGTWKRFRREVVRRAASGDEAQDCIEAMYDRPEFANYNAARARLWQTLPKYKAYKRDYDKRHYRESTAAKRKTPEARARLAAQARERRARKRGASPVETI